MSTPDALNRAIDATFNALNALDAAALRSCCTPRGQEALTALLSDEVDRFARFPASLLHHQRAAVRGILTEGEQHKPLWLSFEAEGNAWRCTGTLASREDAQSWLASAPTQADGTAEALFLALCDALNSGELDLIEDRMSSSWRETQASVHRWSRSLGQVTLARLIEAPRVVADRAAAHVDVDGQQPWICARFEDGAWRLLALVDEGAARLFLARSTDEPAVWERLADSLPIRTIGKAFLPLVGIGAPAPAGTDAAAWAILTEPPAAGLEATLGAVKALPQVGRAAFQVRLIDPSDPDWTEDERWAYLEQAEEGQWTVRHAQTSGTVAALLAGLDMPWPTQQQAGPNDALRDRLRDVADKLKGSDGEQRLDPQIFADLFSGFAEAVKTQAKATPPREDDVVDLQEERARRSSGERDLGRALSEAFSGMVRDADDGSGEVRVDADFLKEQAPQIASGLLGALAKALVPDSVSIDVPADPLRDDLDGEPGDSGSSQSTDAGDGRRTVKLDLDLGSFIGKLFEPQNAPKKDDDA